MQTYTAGNLDISLPPGLAGMGFAPHTEVVETGSIGPVRPIAPGKNKKIITQEQVCCTSLLWCGTLKRVVCYFEEGGVVL